MKRNLIGFLICIFVSAACNNTVPAANPDFSSSKKGTKEQKDENKESQTQVLNDISIKTEGDVAVYRAFLSYESGNLVPASNTTSLGKPVYLNLNITEGWKEENGRVSLGASERISTDNGTVILDEADLFKDYTSFSAGDAKFIRLKALINSMTGPINYFVVDYKVWDKNGNGVITGSYKFNVE